MTHLHDIPKRSARSGLGYAALAILTTLASIVAPVTGQDTGNPPPSAPGATATEAGGKEKPPKHWSNSTELGYVQVTGNSDSNTGTFKNTLTWKSGKSSTKFKVEALRTESADSDSFAVGTSQADFTLVENNEKDVSAENAHVEFAYNWILSERLFWETGGSWSRNRFKGINDRFVVGGGIGNQWFDTEKVVFRSDYALTATFENDVIDDPETDDFFPGVRLATAFTWNFKKDVNYRNETKFFGNFKEASDWRLIMTNSLSVTVNQHTKLKVSLQWLYDNDPNLEEIELFATSPPVSPPIGEVLVPLDELDTIFTTALVFDF